MRLNQRGDTIIEVLLATVVISIVIAGAYTLTNRATRINQNALERTTVSNIMREQIELIRGARTTGVDTAVWDSIISNKKTSTAPNYTACAPTTSSQPFYIDPSLNDFNNSSFVTTFTNSPNYNGLFRVWVEAYQPASVDDYIDFHVRACWEGIGGEVEQNSALVMRIAE